MSYGAGRAAAHRTIFPTGLPNEGGQPVDWVYGPSRAINAAKVAFEKWWLWRWF